MQPVLLKIYGSLYPATPAQAASLKKIAERGLSSCQETPPVSLEGDLLKISFEGIYFPVDDFMNEIKKFLTSDQQGKVDVLDLEAWTLGRHQFADGEIISSSAPLNNVLDYSGF